MSSKLKQMKLTSVDLCKRGANPDADIRLMKSAERKENALMKLLGQLFMKAAEEIDSGTQQVDLEKSVQTVRDCCTDVSKSLESIIADNTLSDVEKSDKMAESLQDFLTEITDSIDTWFGNDDPTNGFGKAAADTAELSAQNNEGVTDLKFNLEKMNSEERKYFEALQKKYAIEDNPANGAAIPPVNKEAPGSPAAQPVQPAELHPDVKKALEENEVLHKSMDELRKSLEIKELEGFAKKYEILGKKPAELAPNLYALKKAGEQTYQDFVALLDEQLTMAQDGLFKEFGSNHSSGANDLNGFVSELMKADPKLTQEDAIVKAYQSNPNLDEFTGKMK